MFPSTLINAILLCFLNASIMVTGVILNSLVVICLWRSSQLRKELCYFMILVVSCFDLAVVATNHPILIFSTILWSMEMYGAEIETARADLSILLGGFSVCSMFTLNVERLLALTCPFFHHAAVTKRRLVILLVILMSVPVAVLPSLHFDRKKIGNMLIAVCLSFTLFTFISLNYKMLNIAKSKREVQRVSPTGLTKPRHQEIKIIMKKFKTVSTCSLAVGCIFVCFLPGIIFSLWGFASTAWNDTQVVLSKFWSNTFSAMNSTLNCVIFFWRNSILRREGIKIAKCSWTKRS